MCRVTVGETPADEALQRLQAELEQLQLQQAGQCGLAPDAFRGIPGCKGSGPRLFCGHVPKEATEDLVRAHFSRWGTVTDVYFPRHKKTLKRRPFCFVTFASTEAAERALAESPLNICGIPIKNLTMVEDRDAYYRTKHANTRAALIQALQSIGSTANGPLGPDQLNNLAALLAMEGVTPEAVMALLPQASGLAGFGGMDSLLGSPASLPGSLEAQLAQLGAGPAPRAPSAGLYDAYCPSPMPQLGPRLPSPAAPFAPQAAPRAYSPNQPGFGPAGGLPLEAQLQQFNAAQQALLAQRLQLQQAVSGGMQGYGGGGLPQYAPQQMHFQQGFNSMHQPIPSPPMPAPQLFAQQPQQVQPPAAAGGWGLAGQQPMRGMGAPLMGAPAPRSASGSGSPQEGAQHPHISLDEALAALSKLKAAQQQQQQGLPDALRMPGAPPSAEILAGLGSTSTFSNSPTLSNSPNLGSSPPSTEPGLLGGSAHSSLELPAPPASLWAPEPVPRRAL